MKKLKIVFKDKKKMIGIFLNYGVNKSMNLLKRKRSLRCTDLMRFKKKNLFWPIVSMY